MQDSKSKGVAVKQAAEDRRRSLADQLRRLEHLERRKEQIGH